MEKEIKLKLRNVYGGDGITRPDKVEEIKLARSKVKVTIRQDMGVPIDSTLKEDFALKISFAPKIRSLTLK